MKLTVAVVDDHQLFLKSLAMLVNSFDNFDVTVEALNGKELQDKLQTHTSSPDIALLDLNMPVMDGLATAAWMHEHHPATRLIALSMNDTDKAIIGMIKAGCCAYLLKDTHPDELEKALNEVALRGYYNADVSNINFRRLLLSEKNEEQVNITEKEKNFLKLACSDKTYKQIAAELGISERTVDGYRETLFQKLNVQSRVGMALEAIRKELVAL